MTLDIVLLIFDAVFVLPVNDVDVSENLLSSASDAVIYTLAL
jgi:hypothetical protein